MTDIRHRSVTANGMRLHLAESGPADGPCIILCHGFPESWYSWRHQLKALGEVGVSRSGARYAGLRPVVTSS
jgi:epoxide hydrolase A/B